jgi:type IV secretory pathway VirB10-like protein
MKRMACPRILLSILLLAACTGPEQDSSSPEADVGKKYDSTPIETKEAMKPSPSPSLLPPPPQSLSLPPVEEQRRIAEERFTAEQRLERRWRPEERRPAAQNFLVAPAYKAPVENIHRQYETDRERYGKISDNPVKLVAEEPVSTFSVDVDPEVTPMYAGSWRTGSCRRPTRCGSRK